MIYQWARGARVCVYVCVCMCVCMCVCVCMYVCVCVCADSAIAAVEVSGVGDVSVGYTSPVGWGCTHWVCGWVDKVGYLLSNRGDISFSIF